MKAQPWLWPDHAISKRESRQLREEHNAVVNLNSELLEALKFSYFGHEQVMHGRKGKCACKFWEQARSAISQAEQP